MTIAEYLAAIKQRLLTDPMVASFVIRRERATLADGHVRADLLITDESRLEFSEYVQLLPDGQIGVVTYSYHWADSADRLIRRWDNTPHYPGLASFPHHIHEGETNAVRPGQPMSILKVLDDIERLLPHTL